MLSIRLLGLGQLTERIAVLQSAITHVLNLYGIQAFPDGVWTINLETFNRLVERIVSRANDTRSPGMALFVSGEVAPAVVERGYKPGTLPLARQPAPAPATQTVTIPAQPRPTPIVAIAPQPIQAPARYPLPGSVTLPVIVPPSPQFPETILPTPAKKSNAWLWIGGILALYLLARHETPHRSRSSRSGQGAGRPLSGPEGCRDKEGKFIPVPQCIGKRTPKKEMRDTLRELDGETIEIPEGDLRLKVWEKGGKFRLYVKLDSPKYNKIKDIGYITDKAWDELEYKGGLAYSQKTGDVVGGYKIMETAIDKILRKHSRD